MPRPPSDRVASLRRDLRHRLQQGYVRPGDRFLSGRQLARQADVSYQTADRLIREFCELGLLRREPGSGTFVSGRSRLPEMAELVFDERARVEGRFGAYLLARMRGALDAAGIPYRLRWGSERYQPESRTYPVIWESEPGYRALRQSGAFGILLNSRPPTGEEAPFVDSVEVDDFSGGRLAGEAMTRWGLVNPGLLAGPPGDRRSERRQEGFRQLFPDGLVIHAPSWHVEPRDGISDRVLDAGCDGWFCANDRLAFALREAFRLDGRPSPRLLGFDDAPISREAGISTIAIPWNEFAEEVVHRIRRRLAGDNGTARRVVLAPPLRVR